MTKVHPNSAPVESPRACFVSSPPASCAGEATVLTVWRKSLLLNCSGFTVFDSKGNLVFRVDSYTAGHKSEVVLMDAIGTPILTARRKKLSLGDHWLVYDGEETKNPRFFAKKLVHLPGTHSKETARIVTCGKGDTGGRWECAVEGSYANRACAFYDRCRQRVAEIRRKEAACGVNLGNDVFRLAVDPGWTLPSPCRLSSSSTRCSDPELTELPQVASDTPEGEDGMLTYWVMVRIRLDQPVPFKDRDFLLPFSYLDHVRQLELSRLLAPLFHISPQFFLA